MTDNKYSTHRDISTVKLHELFSYIKLEGKKYHDKIDIYYEFLRDIIHNKQRKVSSFSYIFTEHEEWIRYIYNVSYDLSYINKFIDIMNTIKNKMDPNSTFPDIPVKHSNNSDSFKNTESKKTVIQDEDDEIDVNIETSGFQSVITYLEKFVEDNQEDYSGSIFEKMIFKNIAETIYILTKKKVFTKLAKKLIKLSNN